ncbi:hypothetical protein [Daejeonella sp.]|uniref:hypothetical protein n=1 Tax=Daejeonella sp. TaxID=2805397 RepID=UPI0039835C1E
MKVLFDLLPNDLQKCIKIIAAFLVLISYSCSKNPLPVIDVKLPQVATQDAVKIDAKLIAVEVNFLSTPTNTASIIPYLKYNKTSAINFEFDDNPASVYSLFKYLNTQMFTDGTGREITFRSAIAVNSRGNYNNGDLWENYQGNLSKTDALELVSNGWTLENHGYYHSVLNATDNFGYGKPVADNISENTKAVFEKTGFKMRTLVVPSNDKGYLLPAFQQGIIATTSTNHFEGFQSFPMYGDYVDVTKLPQGNLHFRRDFNDKWDASGINLVKTKIITLFNKSNMSERMLYRIGTHIPDLDAFKSLSAYIKANSNDKCWVTTMQEMVEYFQIREQIVKKEIISEGKLLITLDISNIHKETLFKDFSLLVNSDTPIQSIKVHNARSSSFNLNGLINISF